MKIYLVRRVLPNYLYYNTIFRYQFLYAGIYVFFPCMIRLNPSELYQFSRLTLPDLTENPTTSYSTPTTVLQSCSYSVALEYVRFVLHVYPLRGYNVRLLGASFKSLAGTGLMIIEAETSAPSAPQNPPSSILQKTLKVLF